MKPVYITALLLLARLAGAQLHVIYTIDSVPPAAAGVQEALSSYKLAFRNGNDVDLFANFDTYAKMDSIYGKSWNRKLSKQLSDNKAWADYLSAGSKTLYTDNWNYTKYEFYAPGLIKEIETKACGYNLRCGIQTKQYSRKGKVTSTRMKTVSRKD